MYQRSDTSVDDSLQSGFYCSIDRSLLSVEPPDMLISLTSALSTVSMVSGSCFTRSRILINQLQVKATPTYSARKLVKSQTPTGTSYASKAQTKAKQSKSFNILNDSLALEKSAAIPDIQSNSNSTKLSITQNENVSVPACDVASASQDLADFQLVTKKKKYKKTLKTAVENQKESMSEKSKFWVTSPMQVPTSATMENKELDTSETSLSSETKSLRDKKACLPKSQEALALKLFQNKVRSCKRCACSDYKNPSWIWQNLALSRRFDLLVRWWTKKSAVITTHLPMGIFSNELRCIASPTKALTNSHRKDCRH
ncbi:hypothetical protein HNY73_018815 [Argiope bruennichi]|uniref:Uncharacterized protein n=1 Tax=Argiope bruennichi TaxID=94029 RepID=A0A8T0EEX4_ARGBR|nr:hypothetical protein HNY73_018815 [Argiope bruennichi]